jgi:hypothetical protein
MAMKGRRLLLVLLMMAALVYSEGPVLGCGPFIERAVFTYSKHPDFPLERFAAGELGVLQPTYARSYLAAAYRHLTGAGLDQHEQRDVVRLWNERLKPYWESEAENWVKTWLDARSKVAASAPPTGIEVYRAEDRKDYYAYYMNCPQDAFKTAAATLEDRVKKFGAPSAEVKGWVEAQDQVFANCAGGQSIPSEANTAAPALVQDDRAYQIAAANFYSGNFDAAEKMFSAIAADSSSPWKQVANYLVARALVRKATLGAGAGKTDAATLARAEGQLRKVLADQGLAALHPAAGRLSSFVRFRLRPEERMRELAEAILKKNSKTLYQDLWDYTQLLDQFVNDDQEERKFESLPSIGRADDVTDWVLTYQVTDKAALDYSLEKWAKTSSTPWLIAALSKIDAAHPRAAELISATDKIKQGSPAYATAAFHAIRLMADSGRRDEARGRLDSVLAQAGVLLPPSARNLLLSLRMKLARNLDEFLKYGAQVPAAITYDIDGRELPEDLKENEQLKSLADGRAMLSEEAAAALNQKMPLSLLKQAATSQALPAHLRRELAIAAWTRAALLDDEQTARALVPALESLAPELKEHLGAYASAEGIDARKFAAVYLMLKFPAMRPQVDPGVSRMIPLSEIDNFRDNWWCEASRNAQAQAPDFLSEAEEAAAARELERLVAIGTAPNYLSAQAVAYATKKPDDPRAPEALHLAVRSTRYGCKDDQTTKFSRQAFQLLHKRYPASEWAKKTKYYY